MNFDQRLEEYRIVTGPYASPAGATYGCFEMPGPCGERLTIIAEDGELTSWEHVSVSIKRRVPNWHEMCYVKHLFWAPDECVVQYHPPESEYVNNWANVLHLWRWTNGKFPMPSSLLVGIKSVGIIETKEQAQKMIEEAMLAAPNVLTRGKKHQ